MMYNPRDRRGVLVDYDLSIFQHLPRVPRTYRTGTIPFMTIDLLRDKYWDGDAERLFAHELEAFIWILPFVSLRYQDQKAQKNTPVDRWITSDHNACRKAKWSWADAPDLEEAGTKVQDDFRKEWPLARRLLSTDFARVWKEIVTRLMLSADCNTSRVTWRSSVWKDYAHNHV